MKTEIVTRRADLHKRKQEIEEELRRISAESAVLDEKIIQFFMEKGIDRMTANGVTISLREDHWARAVDKDMNRACEALRSAGLGEYAKESFNPQSLSAWVRERIREGEALPPEFAGAIEVDSYIKVSARKG
jgi:cytosine/adenosine deaminase-related metal-dependent hydrolase